MSDIEFNRKTELFGLPYCKQENISPFTLVDFEKCKGLVSGKSYPTVRTKLTIHVTRYEDGGVEYDHEKLLGKGYRLIVREHSSGSWILQKKNPQWEVVEQEWFDNGDKEYCYEILTRPRELNKRKYLDHWLKKKWTLKEGETVPVIEEWYRVSNSKKQTTLGHVKIDINSRMYECSHFIRGTKEQAIAQLSQMKKEDMPEWKFGYIQTTLKTLQDFDEEAFVADMKAG